MGLEDLRRDYPGLTREMLRGGVSITMDVESDVDAKWPQLVAPGPASEVQVVLNWFRELRERVPPGR